jgi:transposase
MNITRLSVDLSKDVFQIYGVNEQRQGILEKRITSRQKFSEFVAKHAPCEIVMEACGTSNYWARKFIELGCTVKLIAPQYVKPYIQRNKNDFRDAMGIMEASFWPGTPYVTPKTVEQQDIQSLLRIRTNYIALRTSISNQVRGLMKEYGVFVKEGYLHLCSVLPSIVALDNDNGLSPVMKELIAGQYEMLRSINEKIDSLDLKIKKQADEEEVCKRLQAIDGVGPITALAILALVGDGKGFKNGRHFAAYLGLVPKQHSSGKRECLLGISKRGDSYLRGLFIHGGRAVAANCSKKSDARSIWVNRIKIQGGMNKAAVAVANKNARIAMAMILSGENYKRVA